MEENIDEYNGDEAVQVRRAGDNDHHESEPTGPREDGDDGEDVGGEEEEGEHDSAQFQVLRDENYVLGVSGTSQDIPRSTTIQTIQTIQDSDDDSSAFSPQPVDVVPMSSIREAQESTTELLI